MSEKERAAKHYSVMAEQARKEQEVKSLEDGYSERYNQMTGEPRFKDPLQKYGGFPFPAGTANPIKQMTIRETAGGFVVEAHFSKYEEAQEYMKRHFEGVK